MTISLIRDPSMVLLVASVSIALATVGFVVMAAWATTRIYMQHLQRRQLEPDTRGLQLQAPVQPSTNQWDVANEREINEAMKNPVW
jgi:hypothetical protein